MHEGREHLVVPVVALCEGVIHAVNAETPEFVSVATLQKAAASWENRPVTLGHPRRDGKQCSANEPSILAVHGMGIVRNARVDGKKLLCEAWIDKNKAKALHSGMFQRLLDGERMEVSVGAHVVTDNVPGAHNGKAYKASWAETSGDHLAFLPDGRGACSIEMGCGAHRAAMHLVTAEAIEWEGLLSSNVAAFFRALMPRGWGDDEVKADLREALHAADPAARNGEILRVTNNEVVYCVYPPPAPAQNVYDQYPTAWPSKMTYWKRGYTFDSATRAFTLAAERVQVEPTTVYEVLRGLKGRPAYKDCTACDGTGSVKGNPCEACDGNGELKVAAAVIQPKPVVKNVVESKAKNAAVPPQLKAAGCGCKSASPCGCKGESTMAEKATRAEMIAALTTDKFSGFNEQDVALLETASEARLDEFRAASEGRKTEAAAFVRLENDHRNVQARLKVSEERLRTAEEAPTEDVWLAKAPPAIKALLDAHKAEEDMYRGSIIVQLKDLGANTEDELKAKTTKELEVLAKYAHVTVPDFSGRALPVQRNAAAQNSDYAAPNPYEAGIKAAQVSKTVQ